MTVRAMYPKFILDIYPSYLGIMDSVFIVFETYVRKQDAEGVWYFVFVRTESTYKKIEMDLHSSFIVDQVRNRFLAEVYNTILFYIVDPTTVNVRGMLVHERDPDQRSEKERLCLK